MKNLVLFLLITLSFFSCKPDEDNKIITLVNPSDMIRTDEAVVITRDNLVSLIASVPEVLIPILKDEKGVEIPSQADDLDKDGNWDELFFLVDLEPGSVKKVIVSFVEKNQIPEYTVRSNIRFANMDSVHTELSFANRLKTSDSPTTQKYFQMEGPAWENDKVAFRNYYDARNGFDIFGKRTSSMVLDSVGLIAHSYHELADWGMDILKVGNSLGAGAIAIKNNDKVYRFDSLESGIIEILAEGPLRSVFRLGFSGWHAGDGVYEMVHEISIWGGVQFYKSKVTISGLKGNESLITGIVNIDSDSLIIIHPNEKYVVLATHDNQAYDGEKLGMALLIQNSGLIETIEAPEVGEGIVQTYMANLKIAEGEPVEFYFYSGWELQDKRFQDVQFFLDLIRKDADRFAEPIQIK